MPAPTAVSLNSFLRQKGSPMAGLGGAFVQAGRRYGIDPHLLVAISGAESGFGVHAQGHNPFGWGPGIHFQNWRQAINRVAAGLKAGYIDKGLTTVEQIQQKWAPVNVSNDPTHLNSNWAKNVKAILAELGGGTSAATGPATSPTGPTGRPTLTGGPDIRGFVAGELGQAASGRRVSPTQQLTDMVQLIRSTPPAELHQASQQTGLQFQATGRVTELDKRAVGLVQRYLGDPYVWGGAKPGAFDCSGLLQYVWGKLGVNIPRTTYDQFRAGRAVGRNQLRPGDAVFFRGSDARGNLPGHVGMYIGGGKFIEAPHTGAVVRVASLAGRRDYAGARRYA